MSVYSFLSFLAEMIIQGLVPEVDSGMAWRVLHIKLGICICILFQLSETPSRVFWVILFQTN